MSMIVTVDLSTIIKLVVIFLVLVITVSGAKYVGIYVVGLQALHSGTDSVLRAFESDDVKGIAGLATVMMGSWVFVKLIQNFDQLENFMYKLTEKTGIDSLDRLADDMELILRLPGLIPDTQRGRIQAVANNIQAASAFWSNFNRLRNR